MNIFILFIILYQSTSLSLNGFNGQALLMEMEFVVCEVQTEYWYTIYTDIKILFTNKCTLLLNT
jgi:hypothetical protein